MRERKERERERGEELRVEVQRVKGMDRGGVRKKGGVRKDTKR